MRYWVIFFVFIFVLFQSANSALASTYLQCDWNTEAHNSLTGEYMGTWEYTQIFKILNNDVYIDDTLIKSSVNEKEIRASDEYINSNNAKISVEYNINRITGAIDYFKSYEKGLLVKLIVVERGHGSCKKIDNRPKF